MIIQKSITKAQLSILITRFHTHMYFHMLRPSPSKCVNVLRRNSALNLHNLPNPSRAATAFLLICEKQTAAPHLSWKHQTQQRSLHQSETLHTIMNILCCKRMDTPVDKHSRLHNYICTSSGFTLSAFDNLNACLTQVWKPFVYNLYQTLFSVIELQCAFTARHTPRTRSAVALPQSKSAGHGSICAMVLPQCDTETCLYHKED